MPFFAALAFAFAAGVASFLTVLTSLERGLPTLLPGLTGTQSHAESRVGAFAATRLAAAPSAELTVLVPHPSLARFNFATATQNAPPRGAAVGSPATARVASRRSARVAPMVRRLPPAPKLASTETGSIKIPNVKGEASNVRSAQLARSKAPARIARHAPFDTATRSSLGGPRLPVSSHTNAPSPVLRSSVSPKGKAND